MQTPILLSILVLFSCQWTLAQSINWSTPDAIGPAPANGTNGLRPRVAVSMNGEVNVIWGKDSILGQIMHVQGVGGSFSSPVALPVSGLNVDVHATSGPNIAANENDVYVSFATIAPSTGNLYTIKSPDAGSSWIAPVWLDEYLFGNYAVFPHVAIDGEDHPHAAMHRNSGSWTTGAICSVNLGASYTAFIQSSNSVPGSPCATTDPFIVIDDDKHVVLWRQQNGSNYPIYAALSTNNGATFSVKENVDDGLDQDVSCNSSGPEAIIVGDSLIYAWVSPEDNGRVKCGSADMVGLSASSPFTFDQGTTPSTVQSQPTIAGNENAFAVAWQDDRNGTEDVYFAWSVNGLNALTNMDIFPPGLSTRHSPSLAFQDSVFHLVYVDEAEGSVMYTSGTVDLGTDVQDLLDNDKIKMSIHPNPSNGNVYVSHSTTGNVQLRMFDLLGMAINHQAIKSADGFILPTDHVPAGNYVLQLISNEASGSRRLVVLH